MKNIFVKCVLYALSAACLIACSADVSSECGKRVDALDGSLWDSSMWISAADAQVVTEEIRDGVRAADGASWFVSELENEGKIVSAKWMTSGLGVYELFVNGCSIGREILKPGFTHYAKTKYSFTYDVTDAMKTKAGAVNVFAAQVTPGWWADKIVSPRGQVGMTGKKCAFRSVLELTFRDGTVKVYGTDLDNWKAGVCGPVKHAAIFDGEEYDAREVPGYASPEKLGVPELNTEFNGEILPSDGAEVYLREDLALAPVLTYVWEGTEGGSDGAFGKVVIKRSYQDGQPVTLNPGETLVVDFGQNSAAVPDFAFSAEEGTVLTCLTGELLNDGNGAKSRGMDGPEGSVHRLNLRKPESGMRAVYTFAGTGRETFLPRCTFFGYRYISVTATAPVTIESMRSVPVSSITRELESGTLTTGNDLINKLISNTVWGQRSNYLSVTTDCPQRNERLGWTADTQVFAETGSFFANTDRFFHKWLRDLRDSQSQTGGYPGVAPTAQYGDPMMRVGWTDAGVIVPWTVWKQFGDTSIIDESWESMERFMAHVCETGYDHDVLKEENSNFQWADWLSYEPLETCGGKAVRMTVNGKRIFYPEAVDYWNYLSMSYWVIDASMMRDMAAATGRDAARYEKMAEDVKASMKKRFLNTDGTFKNAILNTMQTPALFALKNKLVEGTPKEAMIARLKENFSQHGNCLQTGFLGTSILMETLTANGLSDIAYELLFQRKNPSWLYSVDNGATTIWERWNSYTLDGGMGPKGMNSFNHYAYGCVCQWIWETAAGIAADVACPGFRKIIMKPVPDRRLGHLSAEYRSAAGLVRSSWRYDGDLWIWEFTVPEGATASVTLPGETGVKEYASGSWKIEKELK